MTSGVYKIENKTNNKVYVGSSKSLLGRIDDHFKSLEKGTHFNTYLQGSFNKHGRRSFIGTPICYCPPEYLDKAEQFFIDAFKKILPEGHLFNKELKVPPSKRTIEYYQKLSAANSKRIVSPETKAKLSAINKGNIATPETRAKISRAVRAALALPEIRMKWSECKKGKKQSQETCAKLSMAAQKRCKDPEYLTKLSLAGLAKPPVSEETRRKMSLAKQSPEAKERIRIAQTGLKRSPEARAKMSESAKARAARPGERERRSLARHNAKRGYRHSEETKRKMSESSRSSPLRTPEMWERIRLANLGTKRSPEICKKISEAAKTRSKKCQPMN